MQKLRNKHVVIPILIIVGATFLAAIFVGSSCTDTLFEKINGMINPLMCDWQTGLSWHHQSHWNTYIIGGKILVSLSIVGLFFYGMFHLCKRLISN